MESAFVDVEAEVVRASGEASAEYVVVPCAVAVVRILISTICSGGGRRRSGACVCGADCVSSSSGLVALLSGTCLSAPAVGLPSSGLPGRFSRRRASRSRARWK